MKVYIHLAEGFEEIEALTVVDVLRRANIHIEMVSVLGTKEVVGAHDIKVVSDVLFEEANYEDCDMIVFPGGMPGTLNLEKHKELIKIIKDFYSRDKWIAAICAAPKILGNLGLLKEKKATCYPGFEEELVGAKLSDENVVLDSNIITSRGPGTAITFSLKIVEVLLGKDISQDLMQKMIIL
ncbi:MAG: DJ-1 family glyoxalase III [Eubacteriaceae bacterium]